MTRKPFHNDLAHCDTAYLAAHAIDGKAKCSYHYLCTISTEEWYYYRTAKLMTYSIPFNQGSTKHQNSREDTSETDAKLIEDKTTEEEEQEEYIKVSVGSREEAVFIRTPSESETILSPLGSCQERLQWRHYICKKVTEHHRDAHDEEGSPAS